MKMARAFMMYVVLLSLYHSSVPACSYLHSPLRFGAPSHRLEAQMQATARVLEINCQVIYIPGVMLVSFGDVATHTSEIKVRLDGSIALRREMANSFFRSPISQFLKQANGLDLGKLLASYMVYYNVRPPRFLTFPLLLTSISPSRRSSTTRSQSLMPHSNSTSS